MPNYRASPRARAPVTDLESPQSLTSALSARIDTITQAIQATVSGSASEIFRATLEMEGWMRGDDVVRVVGAGRALLAAAISANRMAHAGVNVHVIHDVVPLPNSARGGAILAASASGRTKPVNDLLRIARRRNPAIRIVGIADRTALEFASLCDVFVGINTHGTGTPGSLRALADTAEHVICQVLDAIVVAAARRAGLDEQALRDGHEDLGDTGPYGVGDLAI
jgi:D-arabinose 5-phosphate isomerase GutQ